MPVGIAGDFTLNGKPYILARASYKGRAWRRTGLPNAVRPRGTDADAQRNALPPENDFVATYDDFSGGFGDAYRNPTNPSRIHWSENFESRFPRQLVHAQGPRTLLGAATASGGSVLGDTQGRWAFQVPLSGQGAGLRAGGPAGFGSVLVYGMGGNPGDGYINTYTPTGLAATGKEFDVVGEYSNVGLPNDAFSFRPALFASAAWIGTDVVHGTSTFARRALTGDANTSTTLSSMLGGPFVVAGNRMWRAGGSTSQHRIFVQSVGLGSDPMATANWSATLSLGSGLNDVQDMVTLDDQVYASMQDGLYAGDLSGTFVNVLSELAGQLHPDNGRHLSVHDGGIVYPYVGGLMYYRPSLDVAESRDIGPAVNSSRSPIRGRFRTTHSYAGWLYGGFYTGSQSYTMAGRDRGNGQYDWYPLQRLPHSSVIRHLTIDTISTPSGGGLVASGNLNLPPRMWALTEVSPPDVATGTCHIYWWPIPVGDTNPLAAPTFSANYCGSARIDFGRDNRGAPETLKVLRRIDVNTDASTFLSGSRYADVYYMLDGGTRTLLGRAQQSPRSTLYFPSGEGSFVTCYDFELSVDSFTGSLGFTPVYRSFVTHGAFLTNGPDEITAIVRIADNLRDRNGVAMRSGAAMISELRALVGGPPVSLIDLTGAQNWVTVQRNIGEEEIYQEGDDTPEVAAAIKMAVHTFS